jgi:hypothetical protein
MYRLALLCCAALLLAGACSDDDKPAGQDIGVKDQKVTPKEVGAADKAVTDQAVVDQAVVDQATADQTGGGDAAAPAVMTNTIAFVKVLANKLPTGTTTDKVEKFVPTDTEATPWAEDTTAGPKGVQSAYDDKAIELIINGHHAPFATEGTAGFAKEDYKTGKDTLQLFIWEMKTAASATKLVANFKTKYTQSWGLTFSNIAGVKDLAIIADDSPNWRVFGHKGKYIYEVTSTKGF